MRPRKSVNRELPKEHGLAESDNRSTCRNHAGWRAGPALPRSTTAAVQPAPLLQSVTTPRMKKPEVHKHRTLSSPGGPRCRSRFACFWPKPTRGVRDSRRRQEILEPLQRGGVRGTEGSPGGACGQGGCRSCAANTQCFLRAYRVGPRPGAAAIVWRLSHNVRLAPLVRLFVRGPEAGGAQHSPCRLARRGRATLCALRTEGAQAGRCAGPIPRVFSLSRRRISRRCTPCRSVL